MLRKHRVDVEVQDVQHVIVIPMALVSLFLHNEPATRLRCFPCSVLAGKQAQRDPPRRRNARYLNITGLPDNATTRARGVRLRQNLELVA